MTNPFNVMAHKGFYEKGDPVPSHLVKTTGNIKATFGIDCKIEIEKHPKGPVGGVFKMFVNRPLQDNEYAIFLKEEGEKNEEDNNSYIYYHPRIIVVNDITAI